MTDMQLAGAGRFDSSSVSSRVKNLITEYLMTGKLKPGDKLPTEHELAAQLGVGRNSIREAIKMMASMGGVEVKRGEGMYVAETVNDSALNPLIIQLALAQGTSEELIELRIFFETAIAELLLEKMRDSDLLELEAINRRIREQTTQPECDAAQLCDSDLEFHLAMLRITRNSLIRKVGETAYTLFFASIRQSLDNEYRGYIHQNHEKIIDSLRRRDLEGIRVGVRESLLHWRQRLECPQG